MCPILVYFCAQLSCFSFRDLRVRHSKATLLVLPYVRMRFSDAMDCCEEHRKAMLSLAMMSHVKIKAKAR